jgi:hypothetical protein
MRFRNDSEIIWKIVIFTAPIVVLVAIVGKMLGWDQ